MLWKLGCRWGKGRPPLFYDFMLRTGYAVVWHDLKYAVGDWLLLADGYNVLGMAHIEAAPKLAALFPEFHGELDALEIGHSEGILLSKATFYPFEVSDRFWYETQRGICRIRNREIIEKFKRLREKYMNPYQSITDILLANRNIVLTGAPGTGKTHIAKSIASHLILGKNYNPVSLTEAERHLFDKHFAFVQFHPSYDYTDFVEGLRPVVGDDDKIGFQRADGILKVICKRAIQSTCMRDKMDVSQVGETDDKPFVLVVDEINRGEMSKILGEAFFSLDPGYRGECGKVLTQYQNLVEDADVFASGFYIPDNVYIIGTMNDIDRSVDTIDFAVRRRFAWIEIAAEDNCGMLDKLPAAVAQEAKKRMRAINAAITSIDCLGAAYHIGATYFLKLSAYLNTSSDNIAQAMDNLWRYHLSGVIREYLRGIPTEKTLFSQIEKSYFGE